MLPLLPNTPFVIGHTPDGQPVWLDPSDYLASHEDKQKQIESTRRGILEGKARELALAIIRGREQWLNDRLVALAPVDVSTALMDFMKGVAALPKRQGDSNKPDPAKVDPAEWTRLQNLLGRVSAWLNTEGIHCVEENKEGVFRLLLKRQGEVLSEFVWRPVPLDNEVTSAPQTN